MDNFPYKNNQDFLEDFTEEEFEPNKNCFCNEIDDPDMYICPLCMVPLKKNLPKNKIISAYIYIKSKEMKKRLKFTLYLLFCIFLVIEVFAIFMQSKIDKMEYAYFAPYVTLEDNSEIMITRILLFSIYNIYAIALNAGNKFKFIAHAYFIMWERSIFSRILYFLIKYTLIITVWYFWIIKKFSLNCLYDRIDSDYIKATMPHLKSVSSDIVKEWFYTNYPVEIRKYITLLTILFIVLILFVVFMDVCFIFLRHKINVYNKEIAEMVEGYYKDDKYVRFD